MKARITTTGIKSMINIELIKTAKVVDQANTLNMYPLKVKAYKKAKALKDLLAQLHIESDEFVVKQLEELSGREITLN